jgi:hypothetical protein
MSDSLAFNEDQPITGRAADAYHSMDIRQARPLAQSAAERRPVAT